MKYLALLVFLCASTAFAQDTSPICSRLLQ